MIISFLDVDTAMKRFQPASRAVRDRFKSIGTRVISALSPRSQGAAEDVEYTQRPSERGPLDPREVQRSAEHVGHVIAIPTSEYPL